MLRRPQRGREYSKCSSIKQQPGLAVSKRAAKQEPRVTPAQWVPSPRSVGSHSTGTPQAEGDTHPVTQQQPQSRHKTVTPRQSSQKQKEMGTEAALDTSYKAHLRGHLGDKAPTAQA